MKTYNWREEFRNVFGNYVDESLCCNGKDCCCNGDDLGVSIEHFIQSLIDKQKEEIILAISDSYINSIHTSNNEGARLWRNELINKLINKTK